MLKRLTCARWCDDNTQFVLFTWQSISLTWGKRPLAERASQPSRMEVRSCSGSQLNQDNTHHLLHAVHSGWECVKRREGFIPGYSTRKNPDLFCAIFDQNWSLSLYLPSNPVDCECFFHLLENKCTNSIRFPLPAKSDQCGIRATNDQIKGEDANNSRTATQFECQQFGGKSDSIIKGKLRLSKNMIGHKYSFIGGADSSHAIKFYLKPELWRTEKQVQNSFLTCPTGEEF